MATKQSNAGNFRMTSSQSAAELMTEEQAAALSGGERWRDGGMTGWRDELRVDVLRSTLKEGSAARTDRPGA